MVRFGTRFTGFADAEARSFRPGEYNRGKGAPPRAGFPPSHVMGQTTRGFSAISVQSSPAFLLVRRSGRRGGVTDGVNECAKSKKWRPSARSCFAPRAA